MPDGPKAGRTGHPRPAPKPTASHAKPASPQKPKPSTLTTRKTSPARTAAFHILEQLETNSAHSDDLLHGPLLANLSQPDKDLTTALVLGVLRWQILLDARIRRLLTRPDTTLPTPVAIALRLAAFQLLAMERIPAHAAVHESVELVRAAGHEHAAGMVNAVLRKLVNAPRLQDARRPLAESVEALAERLAHPAWLVQRWIAAFGRTAAEAICVFNQQQPGCPTLFHDDPTETFPTMDAGSRLVAELAAAARPEARRVWDCCAAPGGKTVVLGRRLPHATLLATDASPVRARRLTERLRRDLADRDIRPEVADAATLPDTFGAFDLILCDVPCSGTGTLARNPEIRHRLRPEDLARQAERQRRILTGALRRLAPGGAFIYSTCSLESQECEAIVQATIATAPTPIQILPALPILQELLANGRLQAANDQPRTWTRGDFLRTLPGATFPADGFFAAVLTTP